MFTINQQEQSLEKANDWLDKVVDRTINSIYPDVDIEQTTIAERRELIKETDSYDVFDTKAKIGDTSMYSLANYMNNIFGEYGVKEYSVKEEIREYNSEENPLNNEKSLVEEPSEEFDLF